MWNFQEVDRDGASTSESNAAARKSSQACSPLPPLSRSLPAAMTDAAPQAAVETTPQSTIVAKKFETESEHSVSAAPLSHILGAQARFVCGCSCVSAFVFALTNCVVRLIQANRVERLIQAAAGRAPSSVAVYLEVTPLCLRLGGQLPRARHALATPRETPPARVAPLARVARKRSKGSLTFARPRHRRRKPPPSSV